MAHPPPTPAPSPSDDPLALYTIEELARALMSRTQCCLITMEQPDDNKRMGYRALAAGSPAELLGLAVIGSRYAQEVYASLKPNPRGYGEEADGEDEHDEGGEGWKKGARPR